MKSQKSTATFFGGILSSPVSSLIHLLAGNMPRKSPPLSPRRANLGALFTLWTYLGKIMLWFSPSQQLSTKQPLAHSPPVGWGKESQE